MPTNTKYNGQIWKQKRVANYIQYAKSQITKTIVRKVQRAHRVPRCNEAYLSLLKIINQGSCTLSGQPLTDAKA